MDEGLCTSTKVATAMTRTTAQKNSTEILIIVGALAGFSMLLLVTVTDLAVRTAVEIALIENTDIH